jgi:DeoR/GlpR family transcriptional regulator of sugar metabolism
VEQIEQEIVQFVEQEGKVDPDAIAGHFKLSKESVIFLLTRLAKQGKIQFATDKGGETS